MSRARGRTGWRFEAGRAIAVLVAFQVAAVAGALAWRALVHPARWTRVADGARMSEVAWGRIFNADAVFVLVAAVLGVGLGVVSVFWRRGDPRLNVLVVGSAAALAGWVMTIIGGWIGPPDPFTVLGGLPVGATAPVQLEVSSDVVYLAWPFASLMGALLVLLVVLDPESKPSGFQIPGPASGVADTNLQ